jgi:hypothetical protein
LEILLDATSNLHAAPSAFLRTYIKEVAKTDQIKKRQTHQFFFGLESDDYAITRSPTGRMAGGQRTWPRRYGRYLFVLVLSSKERRDEA